MKEVRPPGASLAPGRQQEPREATATSEAEAARGSASGSEAAAAAAGAAAAGAAAALAAAALTRGPSDRSDDTHDARSLRDALSAERALSRESALSDAFPPCQSVFQSSSYTSSNRAPSTLPMQLLYLFQCSS